MNNTAFINQLTQEQLDSKVDVIANLMQKDPQRAIQIQVAEASKTWDETNNTSIKDVLTRVVLPTITASIGNAIFWDLVNTRGEAAYAGTIQFSFTSFGNIEDDSLETKTDFSRFKQTQSYDRTMHIDQTKEIPYEVIAPQDYSLMGKGNVFQKFISQNQKVITLFFENLILKTIVSNVPTENVREELINETKILKDTFKDDVIKYSNLLALDILKIRNIGVGNKDKLISRMIEGGLTEANFVALVSPTYELVLRKTLAFSVAGAQASANAFSQGIREAGTYNGVRIIVANRLGIENHYILLPIGELSPIGLGLAYMEGSLDKMLGTTKMWLSNTEFKYGIKWFDLFQDLVFMCKNPLSALVAPTASIGIITQTTGKVTVPVTYTRGTRTTTEIGMIKLIPSTYTKLDTYVKRGTNSYTFEGVKPGNYTVEVRISYLEGNDVVDTKVITVTRSGTPTNNTTNTAKNIKMNVTNIQEDDNQVNVNKERNSLEKVAKSLKIKNFKDISLANLKDKIKAKKQEKEAEAKEFLDKLPKEVAEKAKGE